MVRVESNHMFVYSKKGKILGYYTPGTNLIHKHRQIKYRYRMNQFFDIFQMPYFKIFQAQIRKEIETK